MANRVKLREYQLEYVLGKFYKLPAEFQKRIWNEKFDMYFPDRMVPNQSFWDALEGGWDPERRIYTKPNDYGEVCLTLNRMDHGKKNYTITSLKRITRYFKRSFNWNNGIS